MGQRQVINRRLDMRFLASRTATRTGEPLSFYENISAGKASNRKNGEPSPLRRHRARNMGEMIKNLPLPDAESLRKFSDRHVPLAQKGDHPLANGLWLIISHHRIFPRHKPIVAEPIQRAKESSKVKPDQAPLDGEGRNSLNDVGECNRFRSDLRKELCQGRLMKVGSKVVVRFQDGNSFFNLYNHLDFHGRVEGKDIHTNG